MVRLARIKIPTFKDLKVVSIRVLLKEGLGFPGDHLPEALSLGVGLLSLAKAIQDSNLEGSHLTVCNLPTFITN
jgi:hypothetical protein